MTLRGRISGFGICICACATGAANVSIAQAAMADRRTSRMEKQIAVRICLPLNDSGNGTSDNRFSNLLVTSGYYLNGNLKYLQGKLHKGNISIF